MDEIIRFFTSFRGRISRKSWWLGQVIVAVLGTAGTLMISPELLNLDGNVVPPPNWVETIWGLLLVVPFTAITVKRFNDRNRPNWWGYAVGLIFALFTIAPHFGFFTFGPDTSASMTELIAVLVFGIPLLSAFIDNGFLRGTRGPNRYGPDPLQSKEPDVK